MTKYALPFTTDVKGMYFVNFVFSTDTMPTCIATQQGWWPTQSWATGTSTRASRPQRPED